MGSEVAAVALAFRLAPDGGLAVALLFLALVLPTAVLGATVGGLADRLSPRTVIGAALAVQGVIVAAMTQARQPVPVLLFTFALGSATAAIQPAAFAAIGRIASRSQLASANAWTETARNLSALGGPAVGGILVASGGTSTALWVAAATFVVASGVAGVFMPGQAWVPDRKRLSRGYRTLLADPLLRSLLGTLVVTIASSSMVTVSLVFFTRDELGGGPSLYGVLVTTWGAGMIVGPLVYLRLLSNRDLPRLALLAASMVGAAVCLTGTLASTGAALAAFLVGGAANAIQNISMRTMLHRRYPGHLYGTVYGAYVAVANASVAIGFLGAGFVADHHSRTIYIVAGAITVAVACAGGFKRLGPLLAREGLDGNI
jgi:predicted MFS family arabinose efflux permease